MIGTEEPRFRPFRPADALIVAFFGLVRPTLLRSNAPARNTAIAFQAFP